MSNGEVRFSFSEQFWRNTEVVIVDPYYRIVVCLLQDGFGKEKVCLYIILPETPPEKYPVQSNMTQWPENLIGVTVVIVVNKCLA